MRKPWFNPKRYGFGVGLPCSWEGWLVLAAFVAVMLGLGYVLDDSQWRLRAAIGGLAVAALVAAVVTRTRGGWRWRWGRD